MSVSGAPVGYDRSVFINCPFDPKYKPLLNAVIFCVAYLDFSPRLATERIDSGETRIGKILELIRNSRFGIHDLSRSKSAAAEELARHNMPLELGIDLGCRHLGSEHHRRKLHLIMEEERYRHQAAISDLSNSDLAIHGGKPKKALAGVRNFLAPHTTGDAPGPTEIWDRFTDFQGQLFIELAEAGHSKADIKALPVAEYIEHIQRWMSRPR